MMNAGTGGGSVGGGGRRAHSSMSAGAGRYNSRSWHPSPLGSEDESQSATEEPQFYKEEKKNRIKMEIARRRQQIEENACLHDELTRLAKLRETAELSDRLNVNAYGATGTPMSPAMAAAAAAAGVGVAGVGVANHTSAAGGAGTSVLKSVDEILRSNGASHLHVPSSSVHGVIGSSDHLYNNHGFHNQHNNPGSHNQYNNRGSHNQYNNRGSHNQFNNPGSHNWHNDQGFHINHINHGSHNWHNNPGSMCRYLDN